MTYSHWKAYGTHHLVGMMNKNDMFGQGVAAWDGLCVLINCPACGLSFEI